MMTKSTEQPAPHGNGATLVDIAKSPGTRAGFILGAIYMSLAALCFTVMNVLIREAATELHPLQIAFLRNIFALTAMLPWLWHVGFEGLRTRRLGMQLLRGSISFVAMALWFTSVTLLPLAEAVALNFTLPLFVTAGAALILSERVGIRRWIATAVGFLGTLVILRPGFEVVTLVSVLPIFAALAMAATSLIVKSLSGTENPNAIVFYMNALLTPISFVPALFVWTWPSGYVWGLTAILGLLAMIAHMFFTRAYRHAEASAIMPLEYLRLPLIAIIAYILYMEIPDGWTWAGAAIIVGSAIYIAHRESRVLGQRRTEHPGHTGA
jgi:drug/metabolite transporter (DMT)-like permease